MSRLLSTIILSGLLGASMAHAAGQGGGSGPVCNDTKTARPLYQLRVSIGEVINQTGLTLEDLVTPAELDFISRSGLSRSRFLTYPLFRLNIEGCRDGSQRSISLTTRKLNTANVVKPFRDNQFEIRQEGGDVVIVNLTYDTEAVLHFSQLDPVEVVSGAKLPVTLRHNGVSYNVVTGIPNAAFVRAD